MQSAAKLSVKCKIGCGVQPPPPVPSVAYRRPCPSSRCRAFTSTASLSTWQTTKHFNALHAPARGGMSVRLAQQLPITSTHISLIAGLMYAEHAVLCLQPRAPVHPYVMHNAIKSVF